MPTASVLHYATECFEGLKFYRGYDSRLRLFRPNRNAHRMLRSAVRISLPAFNPAELEKLITKLVSVDGGKWLPKSRPGTFMYLRPTMIATGAALGVQKPKEALLYVIACCFPSFDEPAGTLRADPNHSSSSNTHPDTFLTNGNGNANFITASSSSPSKLPPISSLPQSQHLPPKPNLKPGLRLLASANDMVRAWPGGFGFAKVGANYGPSLIAQAEARERGYDQILWLFGPQCEVTEAGASNFFVVWRTKEEEGGKLQLVTAPLDNKVILEGVTRGSILELARERLIGVGNGELRKMRNGGAGKQEDWMQDEIEALEVSERKYTMSDILLALQEGRLIEAFAAGTAVSCFFLLWCFFSLSAFPTL